MKPQHHKPTPLVFKTPGRECAHATRGCCPKCVDPMDMAKERQKKHRYVKQNRRK